MDPCLPSLNNGRFLRAYFVVTSFYFIFKHGTILRFPQEVIVRLAQNDLFCVCFTRLSGVLVVQCRFFNAKRDVLGGRTENQFACVRARQLDPPPNLSVFLLTSLVGSKSITQGFGVGRLISWSARQVDSGKQEEG